MKALLVDKNGYEQFFEEFDKLKMSLTSNAAHGSEVYADAVGDGWHDNFDYEEAMRQEKMIQTKIMEMTKQKDLLKVIDAIPYSDDYVCLDDKIEVAIKYSEDDEDIEIIKLTGKFRPDDDLNEVTLNSPIGKAIYKQAIGSNVIYEVNNKIITVTILRKVN